MDVQTAVLVDQQQKIIFPSGLSAFFWLWSDWNAQNLTSKHCQLDSAQIHLFMYPFRFPILRSGIRTKVVNAMKIVVAAVCLHNYIISIGDPDLDEEIEQEEEVLIPEVDAIQGNEAAARVRGEIYRDWLMEHSTWKLGQHTKLFKMADLLHT